MATLKRLNKETGTYEIIPVGGGVPEAPEDGKQYVRKDGEWVIVETPTKTSDLTNDSGFLTEHQDISGLATKTELNKKVDKVDGKQLSTEDFTTLLKQKLEGLSNYDDTEISQAVSKLRTDLDTLVSGDTTTAIKTFNEVIAFLDGISDTEDLSSIVASIEQQIAGKMDKDTLAAVATSGSFNDLSDVPAKITNLRSYTTATTVASLNADYENIYVTLTANDSLSASATGTDYNGRTITAYVYTASARTITIPTTGNYVSMCGSSFTTKASGWVEFNLTCINGIWHIAKLEQE
jgi:hypothetical protein